jgi:preprotein translocase subunit SecF
MTILALALAFLFGFLLLFITFKWPLEILGAIIDGLADVDWSDIDFDSGD